MADWATIAEVGTAAGTLVLAFATFGATRSANRSARIAERAFEARLRPVLVPSRLEDPAEKIMWGDQHWTRLVDRVQHWSRARRHRRRDCVFLEASARFARRGRRFRPLRATPGEVVRTFMGRRRLSHEAMIAENLLRDVKIGLRVLVKERTFCALAVVVLALGTSGVTTMFSVVNGVMLRGFAFPNASRLISLNGAPAIEAFEAHAAETAQPFDSSASAVCRAGLY